MEKGSKLMVWSLVIAAIGCVLLLFSLLTPWWTASTTITDKDAEGKPDRYDNERDTVFVGGDIRSGIGAYSPDSGRAVITGVVTFGVITALLLSLVTLALMVLSVCGKNVHLVAFSLFGAFVLFFCLAIPIVFTISLPYAMENDDRQRSDDEGGTYVEAKEDTPRNSFFGSHNENVTLSDGTRTTEQVWGPDFGFFLTVFAILFLIPSYVMFFIGRRSSNGD